MSSTIISAAYAASNLEVLSDSLIPGRCAYSEEPTNKTAAALVVSTRNSDIYIAPISADQFSKDYFDYKSSKDLLEIHGKTIENLSIKVSYSGDIINLETQDRDNHFKATIEENSNFLFLKAFKNGVLFRECHYFLSFRK